MVCVATVADIIDDMVLIHLDGWAHTYDFWCATSSNYIHPVGWSESVKKKLMVPQGNKGLPLLVLVNFHLNCTKIIKVKHISVFIHAFSLLFLYKNMTILEQSLIAIDMK